MSRRNGSLFASLGILRQALLGATLVNTALPALHWLIDFGSGRSLWDIIADLVAPSISLLFAVVILFDYIMSRVRAADAEGEERARFIAISRVELLVLALTLLFWIPYFAYLLA